MKLNQLSSTEILLLKALAILLIALHNFLHAFPTPQQNEFVYNRLFYDQFVAVFTENPGYIPQAIFSYLGHFGVQVFILLSAYGLTLKHQKSLTYYRPFIFARFGKIYPALLLAILAWLCLRLLWLTYLGEFSLEKLEFFAILLKLLLISSFVPGYELEPVGPWWFIPFIFQFYLIFPLLSAWQLRFGNPVLLVLAAIGFASGAMAASFPFGIYYTVLPHLPLICAGMYLASNTQAGRIISLNRWWLLGLLVLFWLSNISAPLFIFSHLTAGILLLAGLRFSVQHLLQRPLLASPLSFIGTISLQIFLVNGFCRTPLFEWALADGRWWMVYGYTLVFCLVTGVLASLLYWMEQWLRREWSGAKGAH